mmetsp:Transcript_37247/g.6661  ORF Transcript_37247/g.6661 Transcript_37247/m.6661 type:complete len:86 (+) Transcript_37247:108-365(+)
MMSIKQISGALIARISVKCAVDLMTTNASHVITTLSLILLVNVSVTTDTLIVLFKNNAFHAGNSEMSALNAKKLLVHNAVLDYLF